MCLMCEYFDILVDDTEMYADDKMKMKYTKISCKDKLVCKCYDYNHEIEDILQKHLFSDLNTLRQEEVSND